MPRLFVDVVGGGASVRGGAPPNRNAARDPDLQLPMRLSGASGHFDVPAPGRFVVRIERQDMPRLPLQVELDLASNGRTSFPAGRPSIMTLVRVRGAAGSSFRLTVQLGEPAEVVFVSGQNPALPELFRRKALSRFAFMLRRREIPTSCVLTLFHCVRIPGTGGAPTRYEMTRQAYVPKAGGGRSRAVLMTSVDVPDAGRHVRTVYEHLAEAGQHRPRLIREFGFLGHAYWMGPVMFNTGRPNPHAENVGTQSGRDHVSEAECHQLCPTDRPHHHLGPYPVPRILDVNGDVAYGLRDFGSTWERQPDGSMRLTHYVLRRYDWGALMDFGLAGGSHQPTHGRSSRDRDPRNTDFCDASMFSGVDEAHLREALHPDGIARVWGCNNGIMGGAFRRVQRDFVGNTENKLIQLRSQRHGHGGRPTAFQEWHVRQGDAKLLFLSRTHRGYPQVLARTLDRPCHGTVPGTYGEYQSEEQLGAMNAAMTSSMRRLAAWGLYPGGVPNDITLVDRGGYFRFDPDPDPVPWTVRVLVTGFVPFGSRGINSSQRTAQALQGLGANHIPQLLGLGSSQPLTPPWLDLTLDVDVMSNVGVEFSSPGVPGAVRSRGAGQILQRLRSYDADLVIILGEAGLPGDFRLERFGRNWGDPVPDNAGRSLPVGGATFPSRTTGEALESTIPLRAWLHALTTLRRANYQLDHPPTDGIIASPGGFVCNESFYTLLLEARGGLPPSRRPTSHAGSGRWIQMLHVRSGQANTSADNRLARGVAKVIASYVLSMTWAGDVPGARVIWDSDSQRPAFPRYIATPTIPPQAIP